LGWTIVRGAAFAQVWLGLVAETAGASGRPIVFGRGDNPIPWVDIHEVAQLVVGAVEDRSLRGETLDICGPEALTLMQLAQAYMDHNGVAGHPRRIPRPMLHVMAGTVGRFKPQLGRQARAALAMDVLPPAEDSATRARFPDLPRRPVSEVIAELPVRAG
jgi:NADH dehydrogenase